VGFDCSVVWLLVSILIDWLVLTGETWNGKLMHLQKRPTGAAQDFEKKKARVGKASTKDNYTDTEFKSRSVNVPSQQRAAAGPGVAVNERGKSLGELLAHSGHYSASVRKDAIQGIRTLLGAHPQVLHRSGVRESHMLCAEVLSTCSELPTTVPHVLALVCAACLSRSPAMTLFSSLIFFLFSFLNRIGCMS
jgi:pre-rRNA-processing protein IPI1